MLALDGSLSSYTRPPPIPSLFPYTTLFRSVATAQLTRVDRIEVQGVQASRVDVAVMDDLGSDTDGLLGLSLDRKSTRLNSSHSQTSYAVFCSKKTRTPKV